MWMVDSSDNSGKQVKIPTTYDPALGCKLRPLMRRLSGDTSAARARGTAPYSTMSIPPCFCPRNPNTILPLWNQYPIGGVIGDYGVKRETEGVPLVNTRWNPTAEQLQTLEEMYKRGMRTPTAEQIQKITIRLRKFGKIEGKNVFYWFQNHKARERQKKRRQLELLAGKEARDSKAVEAKQTGLIKKYFEIGHNKKLQEPSNFSTPSEESASMHGSVISERKKLDMWTQVPHKELQSAANLQITKLALSFSYHSDLQENTKPVFTDHENIVDNNFLLQQNIRTLELFPMGEGRSEVNQYNVSTARVCLGNKWPRPNEFIEFLPMAKK